MKSKLIKMAISFVSMIAVSFAFSSMQFFELGIHNPHVGLLFVLGLLFGPYGAIGAVLANIMLDVLNGFTPIQIIPSAIISFGVSYLAYKLWYSGFKTDKITKPKLDNIYHLLLFLSAILICGFIYSSAHADLIGIFFSKDIDEYLFASYFLNFVNIAFIFGILGIWLSKKFDFVETPKTSKRPLNERLYNIIFISLVIVSIITAISLLLNININFMILELILIGILLICYLTKPFAYKINTKYKKTISEKIIRNFLIITLIIAIMGIVISQLSYKFLIDIGGINPYLLMMPAYIITDIIITLFFIPGIIILRYIESHVMKPILSFSEIEDFINENEKIESEGLVEIYSKYVNEQTEIGTLARSYTNLINHNNQYIENIHEIEGEKERIKAELEIAENIQAANLPTEAIITDDFIVNGYSHPAKEVGGDFFDYYMLDEDNLAIVIGDASGKGVPAAIVAMITQVIIKQMLKYDNDPSKILHHLNNQLCENNPESMFITLWLGIYNRTTHKLTFSNAGHNPPLINENGEFKYLNIESGLVLGIMEDFDFITEEMTLAEEIVIYTDGITDANNENNEMYSEERLLNFFNEFEHNRDLIRPLLNDISSFTKDAEQYDDMTLLYLRKK